MHPTVESGRWEAPAAHLWVPRGTGLGSRVLLLAMAMHGPAGWPDNCSYTGRLLGVRRATIRQWRDDLVQRGLLDSDGSVLRPRPAAIPLLRKSSPLPWGVLYRRQKPSPAVLLAMAEILADTLGWHATRKGVRSDAERASMAQVSRNTIRAARAILVDLGMVQAAAEQHGRALVLRCTPVRSWTGSVRSAHRKAPGVQVSRAAANAARFGRLGGGGRYVSSPIVVPTVSSTLPAARVVQELAPGLDGCTVSRNVVGGRDRFGPQVPQSIGAILEAMFPAMPQAKAAARQRTDRRKLSEREQIARIDPDRISALCRMRKPRAVQELLLLGGVFRFPGDRAVHPSVRAAMWRRLQSWTELLASRFMVVDLLRILIDVAMDLNVLSIGSVMLYRVRKLLRCRDANAVLSYSRAGMPVVEMLELLRRRIAAA